MFMVNWYGPNRTELRKNLSLMIFRAQRTKILNAGKMSDLNYPLFIAVNIIILYMDNYLMSMISDCKEFSVSIYINFPIG